MKQARWLSLRLALVLAAGAALLSCRSSTSLSTAKEEGSKGYSVSVRIGGVSAAPGSAGARSIISDTNVGSVNVAVFDYSSHELAGYGTLAKKTDYWGGAIDLGAGDFFFEATANGTSGTELYFGIYEATVGGEGASITIPMSAANGAVTLTNRTSSGSAHGLYWNAIASSADGSKLASVVNGGDIWTSTAYGQTWTDRTPSGSAHGLYWASIVSSANGTKLAATETTNGDIWTSTDSGQTWTNRTLTSSAHALSWRAIASSADGSKLAAVVYGGDIWTGYGMSP